MDLGRPVARHLIRRPHEVIDLESELTLDESPADEEELSTETPER